MSLSSLRIVVTGLVAQHPRLGGVAWDYVQYPVGLARLGHDVYYLEDSGEWPYNDDGGPTGDDWVARDPSANVEALARVMARFGLEDRWAYRFPLDGRWFGLPDAERRRVLESADLLVNVSGVLEHPEEYRSAGRLAYVDGDPVFTQARLAAGDDELRARVEAHDVHFSFGERLSAAVPATGHDWKPTRQPIVLDAWRPSAPRRDVYTTVMSWTSYEPLRLNGYVLAQKDVEFARFVELPALVPSVALEVALGGTRHADWESGGDAPAPAELLAGRGWRVVSAATTCGDVDAYRSYVESSRGEWSVAKNGYVVGRPGWFGSRSPCYLAAGRPVVVQDTGLGGVLPLGEGVLAFATPEEAAEGIREVEGDYDRHARAAREIAEAEFDAGRVLGRLVEEAMS